MSLRFATLIALQDSSATGYEIAKRFDEGLGYFWHSSHQQIYLELRKMSESGLVEFEKISQTGKPDKKVYHVTESGLKALREWLLLPTKHSAVKDNLLMKIYAGPLGSVKHLLAEVKHHQLEYQTLLTVFLSIEKQWFQNVEELESKHQYVYLTLRNGIISTQAWLEWSEEVIVFLNKQAKS